MRFRAGDIIKVFGVELLVVSGYTQYNKVFYNGIIDETTANSFRDNRLNITITSVFRECFDPWYISLFKRIFNR